MLDLVNRIACVVGRGHDPIRHPLGGFVCRRCNKPGATIDDLCDDGVHYVNPVRKLYSRERGEITRTSAWEPTRRGF